MYNTLEISTGIRKRARECKRYMVKNRFIYVLLLPALVLVIFFNYLPLFGITIAFQDYNVFSPEKSTWIGLRNFREIFANPALLSAIFNTLYVSILNLLICFPAGILLALLMNEVKSVLLKKTFQTITYLPHFLSWISIVGIATTLYARSGVINDILVWLTGGERVLFLAQQNLFVPNLILLTLWQGVGWSSVIYFAAICGVDESLYEAAKIDGAGRLKQTIHVTLPAIVPTIVIMLLWQCAKLFSDNFELVYGLQNAFIDFEVVQTIIYHQGIVGGNYQMSTAFGLFQGVINLIVLLLANGMTKRISDVGMF